MPEVHPCCWCSTGFDVHKRMVAGKTQYCCSKCLGERGISTNPKRCPPPKPKTEQHPLSPGSIVMTQELLDCGKNQDSGWTRQQADCLGVKYRKRWTRRVIGQEYSQETYARFVELRDDRESKTQRRARIKAARPPARPQPLNQRLAPRFTKDTYAGYLESDLWNSIRRYVLFAASHSCVSCSNPATQVHHRSYDELTMRGRDVSKLVAICGECHQHIHFDEAGVKAPMWEVDKRLKKLLSDRGLELV